MLLSNNVGLERLWHRRYKIRNIYNLKHYYKTENGLKRIELKAPPCSEIMFTQLSGSQYIQPYPCVMHKNGKWLGQGSCFYGVGIEKQGDDFYIRVSDGNWFLKYEGSYKKAIEKDYLPVKENADLKKKALKILEEKLQLTSNAIAKRKKTLPTTRARPKAKRKRAKPTAKQLAKRVPNRGKLLQKIAVNKSKKQKHVSRKRR